MRPRVVLLTTYFRPIVGGVESNAERLARYLHDAGFGVRVLTKRVTRELPDTEIVDGVPVERIGPLGERSASGKWRLLPAALAWLIRQRASYDVVCCVDYRGVGVAAIAARAVTRRRVVLQAQTPGGLLPKPLTWPVVAIYRRADAIACISHVLEREARTAGVPDSRIHFLPNPVDMDRFRPDPDARVAMRRQLGLAADAVVYLFVGRLSREKGLMELMEAWRLAAPPAGTVLLVAGPDMVNHPWDVGPVARAFAEQHRLDAVRFLGSISDVAPLLRVADVVVQPSHFEALGLSAVEALASGVPVIASAVGGLLDFIVDGQNGLLCPPQDPPALAACLRRTLDDPAFRTTLASRARASVAEQYDAHVVFARFAELLSQLALGPRSAGVA